MKIKINIFLMLLSIATSSYAVLPLPDNLINFDSESGLIFLKQDLNKNALKLLSHFETQKTVTYCGVASVVMILNSTHLAAPDDSVHPPYQSFNQDDFFNDAVSKIISREEVLKKGITLAQLREIIQSYGLHAESYYANTLDIKKFRKLLKTTISNNQFIIVNFLRSAIGEQGGGHHSPIAAYDEKTDRFLLLDVARYKYPAYWVKTEDLWKGVHTMDNGTYRGVITVHERS